jgi:hypothetical protein
MYYHCQHYFCYVVHEQRPEMVDDLASESGGPWAETVPAVGFA